MRSRVPCSNERNCKYCKLQISVWDLEVVSFPSASLPPVFGLVSFPGSLLKNRRRNTAMLVCVYLQTGDREGLGMMVIQKHSGPKKTLHILWLGLVNETCHTWCHLCWTSSGLQATCVNICNQGQNGIKWSTYPLKSWSRRTLSNKKKF